MAELATPTVRLRRFGAELRAIREERGLSIQAVARRVDRSDSALSKLENGRTFMLPRDVNQVLAGYGITDPATRTMLHTLMRDGRKKGWWQHYTDTLPPILQDFVRLESDAESVWTYQPIVIPGLFQTEAYARTVIEVGARLEPRDVEQLVAVRRQRQKVLERLRPPQISMVIDESALRREVGSQGVMQEQLRRLALAARQPNVMLKVLPFSAGAHVFNTGAGMILSMSEPDFSVVFLEELASCLWVEADAHVNRYKAAFGDLSISALSESESLLLIERLMAEL